MEDIPQDPERTVAAGVFSIANFPPRAPSPPTRARRQLMLATLKKEKKERTEGRANSVGFNSSDNNYASDCCYGAERNHNHNHNRDDDVDDDDGFYYYFSNGDDDGAGGCCCCCCDDVLMAEESCRRSGSRSRWFSRTGSFGFTGGRMTPLAWCACEDASTLNGDELTGGPAVATASASIGVADICAVSSCSSPRPSYGQAFVPLARRWLKDPSPSILPYPNPGYYKRNHNGLHNRRSNSRHGYCSCSCSRSGRGDGEAIATSPLASVRDCEIT
ncbi:hypothetical protein Tb927.7.6700 [Trypanosoma brucei brucei TREU927]|uniref:T. brucei spp.-specific protein n=1 Tax=Trypanosoma brucei brucei (strain 927/4 GUTat10.1) TaxID=185431 RepID=Q57Y59_TRYB2|nr:hypothetical protein Tb927.7.6700 [Trypanosoma brucei brucei TREU927]AAX69460.1 hypothetical protein Tb927.7.6700 [Trypanosoma brucei]AAZ12731.1 hypothetical protein Tb927.7.6700 [Trypanosoma brucei brucei TREU927]